MNRRELLTALACIGAAALTDLTFSQGVEEGFTPLFNGKDLSGFIPFLPGGDPQKTWRVEDGIIICTGRPNGYLRTEKEFANFVLRFEYRMMEPGNSGVFLMVLPDRIWPHGVEFQLLHTEVGRIFGVSGGKVDATPVLQRPAKLREWNSYHIIHYNGFVATCVNGHVIAIGANAEPRKGYLIFQSEGAEIHWRNIRIREL